MNRTYYYIFNIESFNTNKFETLTNGYFQDISIEDIWVIGIRNTMLFTFSFIYWTKFENITAITVEQLLQITSDSSFFVIVN